MCAESKGLHLKFVPTEELLQHRLHDSSQAKLEMLKNPTRQLKDR